MRKIKLFVDGHWFDEAYESTAIFIKGLYTELANDERFEIFMAAANPENLQKAFHATQNINYLTFHSHSKYYRLAIDAPRLLNRYKIDVSHFQYTTPLIKNTLQIVTIHDLLFMEFPHLFPWAYRTSKNFLFKRSARQSDLVTTVSKFSANAVMKYYQISPKKIKVIPNGVAKEFFAQHAHDELPDVKAKYSLQKYILSVNRIEPRKNHITLVKAYVKLKLWEKGVRLVMIGRPDIAVPELDQYLTALSADVNENIVWLKNISFHELLSFYRNASLFVYPSLGEGFGIPPLEAAALKTKTLCSNATAMADFTFFGSNLFDPSNVIELAGKIEKALADNDLNNREHIAATIQKRYAWPDIASSFASEVVTLCKG